MQEYVYVVRWYDYDWEHTCIEGVYLTWDEVAAEIVDQYEGRFDYADLKEPSPTKWSFERWNTTKINIDNGDYGRCLIIEKVKVG